MDGKQGTRMDGLQDAAARTFLVFPFFSLVFSLAINYFN
jgi:hypothetical protein